jgi:hypothetical protein
LDWNPDYAALGAGAAVTCACGWTIVQIARSGALRGRMGGTWHRAQRPGLFWLTATILAAGLWAGVLMLSIGLGAPPPLAAAVASALAAASLVALAGVGRKGRGPQADSAQSKPIRKGP